MCMCLYNRMIYNPLGIYPVMGLLGQMKFLFLGPWGNRHTVFHNGWTNLHTDQWCKTIPISLHPLQSLLSPDFLMIVILTGVTWYLNVVLICISLMTSDDEHFFICLWASCLLLKSVCLCPSPTFEWVCLFFSCKSFLVLCRFWILVICQMDRLQKSFPILLVAGSL